MEDKVKQEPSTSNDGEPVKYITLETVYAEVEVTIVSEYSATPSNAPAIIMTIPTEDDADDDDDDDENEEPILAAPTSTDEAPFGIVLVNIRKAAQESYIHCENKYLDGQTPYIALSYRWGELDEQLVAATQDYHARIVSFRLQDFFTLCQALINEPEMKHIEYVWVDAICVDQENIENRKATIYRMKDIYSQAATIIAVPDLHSFHVARTTSANRDAMAVIEKHRTYLYYLLSDTADAQDALVKLDHAWMDTMGLPLGDRQALIMDIIQNAQQYLDHSDEHVTKTSKTTGDDPMAGGACLIHQMETLMLDASAACSIDAYQSLTKRMLETCRRFEWQQQLAQRHTDILRSMQFLQSLMEDWSDRTWVISEYHIAKRTSGKIKFWYNQLSCPELHGHRLFEFDFKKQPHAAEKTSIYEHVQVPSDPEEHKEWKRQRQGEDVYAKMRHHHPYTCHMIESTLHFKHSMQRRLTKRSVLEMMLQTRASKNDDRFHAVIPLHAKYKHYIKDKQSVSQLGISDMLSVRLQLLEWVDTKDRLNLLFGAPQLILPLDSSSSSSFTLPLLPTFATGMNQIKPGLLTLISQSYELNFDRTSYDDYTPVADCVRFVRGGGGGGGDDNDDALDVLWLRPKAYCLWEPVQPCDFYRDIGGKANKLWKDVGLDPVKDTLTAVAIPLFHEDGMVGRAEEEEFDPTNLMQSDLQLVGSWEKNIWIQYRFCFRYNNRRIHPSTVYSMDEQHLLPEGFRIY